MSSPIVDSQSPLGSAQWSFAAKILAVIVAVLLIYILFSKKTAKRTTAVKGLLARVFVPKTPTTGASSTSGAIGLTDVTDPEFEDTVALKTTDFVKVADNADPKIALTPKGAAIRFSLATLFRLITEEGAITHVAAFNSATLTPGNTPNTAVLKHSLLDEDFRPVTASGWGATLRVYEKDPTDVVAGTGLRLIRKYTFYKPYAVSADGTWTEVRSYSTTYPVPEGGVEGVLTENAASVDVTFPASGDIYITHSPLSQ